jgi:uncharacterized cupredoxin-like copper-binding protein
MHVKGWVPAVALAAIVSACTPSDDLFGVPGDGYPDNARLVVEAADWANAETVLIELSEFEFSPETLLVRKGQAYALSLTNTGSMTHRFVARGYFRAIAAKSLMYSDAEASHPLIEAIALEPNESKTLYFVPVTPGDFHLSCDVPFHAMFGMVGRILIE